MVQADSRIVLGLWPIAGITTVGVTPDDARATIAQAIDCGITAFDTAFSYGYNGESDRLLGEFLRTGRDRYFIIGKVGQRWDSDRQRIVDALPETLIDDAETSLQRIGTDCFDLLMLHAPDPKVPLEQSARALMGLQARGLCRNVGVCNVTPSQYRVLATVMQTGGSHCDAIQCPLNLLQRESLHELIPACAQDHCGAYVYWTLMKGLLAGRIGRDHVFSPGDSRPGYAIFQGEARQRAHNVIDAMRPLAESTGLSIAQLSIGWAISQRGVRGVLVGARLPNQIVEVAKARALSEDEIDAIDQIVATHG